jgi:butyryl-CoA dehydrogenase
VPEEYGGAGMDMVAYCVAIEEVSRVCASSGVILSVNNSLVCDPLLRYGTEEQKRDFLAPLASGTKLGCFALTEAEAGSDAGALRTTARRDGDGYVLDGGKVFITNGTHADTALVFANVDLEKKHRGITCFIVPCDTPGWPRHHAYSSSAGPEPPPSRMRVPAAKVFAWKARIQDRTATFDGGRTGSRPRPSESPRGVWRRRCLRQERQQFGKPIADFRRPFYLADMAMELDAARLLVYKAAWAKENTKRCTLEAAQAKLFASEMAQRVTNKALQIHGGYGYTRDYDVERFFRDARITEIYEGTSEIQKLVIADSILKEG